MKSPQQLAEQLVRLWQRADWREQHLLPAGHAHPSPWPLRLSIGVPTASHFLDHSATLRQHLQRWQAVASSTGAGTVAWEHRRYRGGSAPVSVPTHWELARPSECVAAMARWAGEAGAAVQADDQALRAVLGEGDPVFHRLLLRRLALWRGLDTHAVITATRLAQQLAPGCAQGKPLRALGLGGHDSKFVERHATLLTALLDVRFGSTASTQGLATFLDASPEDDHWLLVAPLAPGLLPFARLRVPSTELHTTALAATHILLVENERCLHQLPQPLADTVAILGAGLNLNWLNAPWLQHRHVAYWGDLDTWGLHMLATARSHLPHVHPLLMDRTTFDAHAHLAVPEPVQAPLPEPGALNPEETTLDQHLRSLPNGRLEQEFLPSAVVAQAVSHWRTHHPPDRDLAANCTVQCPPGSCCTFSKS